MSAKENLTEEELRRCCHCRRSLDKAKILDCRLLTSNIDVKGSIFSTVLDGFKVFGFSYQDRPAFGIKYVCKTCSELLHRSLKFLLKLDMAIGEMNRRGSLTEQGVGCQNLDDWSGCMKDIIKSIKIINLATQRGRYTESQFEHKASEDASEPTFDEGSDFSDDACVQNPSPCTPAPEVKEVLHEDVLPGVLVSSYHDQNDELTDKCKSNITEEEQCLTLGLAKPKNEISDLVVSIVDCKTSWEGQRNSDDEKQKCKEEVNTQSRNICGDSFSSANGVNNHKRWKHRGRAKKNKRELVSDITQGKKESPEATGKTRRQSTIVERDGFDCGFCRKTFFSAVGLRLHQCRSVYEKRSYRKPCELCGLSFTDVGMRKHKDAGTCKKKTAIAKERLYRCATCKKATFKKLKELKEHVKLHVSQDEDEWLPSKSECKRNVKTKPRQHKHASKETRDACKKCMEEVDREIFMHIEEVKVEDTVTLGHNEQHNVPQEVEDSVCSKGNGEAQDQNEEMKIDDNADSMDTIGNNENKIVSGEKNADAAIFENMKCAITEGTHDSKEQTAQIDKNVDRRFVCPLCNKEFTTKDEVRTHVRYKHTREERKAATEVFSQNEKLWKCKDCLETFVFESGLAAHKQRFTHPQLGCIAKIYPRHYACGICNRVFPKQDNWTRHRSTHFEQRDYICHICGKGFKAKNNLRAHIAIHLKLKNHKCDFCGKGFITGSTLRRHRRIHTGEKPYVCHMCGRAFNQTNSLHAHVKKYHSSGEKPEDQIILSEKPHDCTNTFENPQDETDLIEKQQIHTNELDMPQDHTCPWEKPRDCTSGWEKPHNMSDLGNQKDYCNTEEEPQHHSSAWGGATALNQQVGDTTASQLYTETRQNGRESTESHQL